MRVALDSNILLRHVNRADPQCPFVARLLKRFADEDVDVLLAPQVLYELWVVVTRPTDVNGLGMSPSQASGLMVQIRDSFDVLPDPADMLERWLQICTERQVKGKRAHDARLVAWMQGHGIRDLATLNSGHFSGFEGIRLRAL